MKSLNAIAFALAILGHAQAVRLLARVNSITKELTWPGTGVTFTFTGTSATIGIIKVSGKSSPTPSPPKILLIRLPGNNSALLTIDGNSTVIPHVNGSSIITPSLSNGTHTVELRKRSEAYFGSIYLGNVTTDGTLNADNTPNRKIEFIGDSITVGYGLDGTLPCTNTAELEDNPKTYAALAANSLKADYSIVAWSGIGLTRNTVYGASGADPIMPERYTKLGAQDADNSYTFPNISTPNAVVIGLGTNDFSNNGSREPLNATAFTSAMVSFVQQVRKSWNDPDLHVFLMTSPMLSDSTSERQYSTQKKALSDAIGTLGNRTHLVEWPTQGASVGCDYHPNAATNAAEAPVLAAAISRALGW
jgi:lysophospholipase L1-like esterase